MGAMYSYPLIRKVVSSANSVSNTVESPTVMPWMLFSLTATLISASTANKKMAAEAGHPWATPALIGKYGLRQPLVRVRRMGGLSGLYSRLIKPWMLGPYPNRFTAVLMYSHATESYAFSQSRDTSKPSSLSSSKAACSSLTKCEASVMTLPGTNPSCCGLMMCSSVRLRRWASNLVNVL